jgi:hypothetical protein
MACISLAGERSKCGVAHDLDSARRVLDVIMATQHRVEDQVDTIYLGRDALVQFDDAWRVRILRGQEVQLEADARLPESHGVLLRWIEDFYRS